MHTVHIVCSVHGALRFHCDEEGIEALAYARISLVYRYGHVVNVCIYTAATASAYLHSHSFQIPAALIYGRRSNCFQAVSAACSA